MLITHPLIGLIGSDREIVMQMIQACGPLPDELGNIFPVEVEDIKKGSIFIIRNILISKGRGIPYKESLPKSLLFGLPDEPGPVIRVLSDFLGSILQTDPKDRVGLTDLLRHRWWVNESTTYPCKCGDKADC
jgi:hypothetical protein